VLDICVKLHQQNISIETIYSSSFYYEIQLSTQNIVPSTCIYNTKHLILMAVIIAWHPWSYPFKNIFQNILQDNAFKLRIQDYVIHFNYDMINTNHTEEPDHHT
jgi:hypothetical protein